jgi:hypothetical protein
MPRAGRSHAVGTRRILSDSRGTIIGSKGGSDFMPMTTAVRPQPSAHSNLPRSEMVSPLPLMSANADGQGVHRRPVLVHEPS